MSNRRNPRQIKKAFVTEAMQTTDSFQNFLANVGQGSGTQNDSSTYGFNPITRNRMKLEWIYRGSWVAGRIIDSVAQDMTREGISVKTEDDPKKMAEFDKELASLCVWTETQETIKWSRLYGGALGFLMIDGQDPSTPLNMQSIKKGMFKGIFALDRWMVMPSLADLVQDYGPHYGQPMFYTTMPDTSGMPNLKIHYSRVIRLGGVKLPYWQAISENLWGMSEIERVFDRLLAYDSTTTGTAQLVFKAHLRTLKIENLRGILGGNAQAMKGLLANIAMIRTMQTNEGLTLIDGKDEFQVDQYQFSGLDAILREFGDQLCGASEIPRSRLFGESPGGLSSDDSTTRTYHEGIKQKQVAAIGPGMEKVYRLTYISKFGVEPPDMFEMTFKPLWQLTAIEKSQIANTTTAAITEAVEKNLIRRATAMRELKVMSRETGVFTTITDEEIKEAEDDPAPTPEALGLEIPAAPTGSEQAGASSAGGAGASRPSRGKASAGSKSAAEGS